MTQLEGLADSGPLSRDDLWMSFSAVKGPKTCSQMPLYVLSVVFDNYTWKDFTHVRVIILRKPRDGDPELRLTDCQTPEPFTKWATYHLHPPRDLPRPVITTSVYSKLASYDVVRASQPSLSTSESKVLSIILEYSAGIDKQDYALYTFRPVRVALLSSIAPKLRVLYDRTINISGEDHAILLFLTSTHLRTNDHKMYHGVNMLNSYSVRILPKLQDRRSLIAPLSTALITRIVTHALDHYHASWAADLLRYGLVQKSWVHVLELFWAEIGNGSGYIANPVGVARAITRRPDMGKYIIRHSSDLISHYSISTEHYRLAHTSLVRAASTLRELHLNTRCFVALKDELPFLQNVLKLECYFYDKRDQMLHPMHALQRIMSGWRSLEEFFLSFSERSQNEDSSENFEELPPPLYSLKTFVSGTGAMTGSRLLHFFANPDQRLSRLRIYGVDGLSNADFSRIFALTAPTLTSVHIELCLLANKDVTSDRALDLHISDMVSIEDINIQGDLVTPLSISRKFGPRSGKICILNPSPEDFLGRNAHGSPLPEAIATCQWSRVNVKFMSSVPRATFETFWKTLNSLAAIEGIRLEIATKPIATYPEIRVHLPESIVEIRACSDRDIL